METLLLPRLAVFKPLNTRPLLNRAEFTVQKKLLNVTVHSSVFTNLDAAKKENAAVILSYPILEKAAQEAGICAEAAYNFYTIFTSQLVAQVPELGRLFKIILLDVDTHLLQQHILNCAFVIKEREEGKLKLWNMPVTEASTIKYSGKGELF